MPLFTRARASVLPVLLTGFALFAAAIPATARETVIEDTPGSFVLEVEVPAYEAQSAGRPEGGLAVSREDGTRVTASGYGGPSETGAPDLPWLRLRVATGERLPRVTLEPLTWTDVTVPGGLAGVPRWITNHKAEAYRDPALFAAARSLAPKVSEPISHRGLRLREITLPLGVYDGGTSVRLLKTFRLRVEFPNPGVAPAPGVKLWLEHAGARNLNGGQYLTALPRPAPLRRTAAMAQLDQSAARLKITIGDRVVDGLDEDGVYALTYAQALEAAGSDIVGTPVNVLRLFAGPKDTLSVRLIGSPVASTLREVPLDVRDANGNGTFDAGDTILFYAHGTSIWKPIPGVTGPVLWEFKSDPWSFENRYYLQWDGTAPGARLNTAAAGGAADTVTGAPHYLRAERELANGVCDLANIFDTEVGFNWYWYGYTAAECSPTVVPTARTISGNQLRPVSWNALDGRLTDTVLIGIYTYSRTNAPAYSPLSSTGALINASLVSVGGVWYRKTSGFDVPLVDQITWNPGYNDPLEGYTVRYTRSLVWTNGRHVFPADAGRRIAYRLTGVPAGGRVLRVVDGVGTQWLALQSVGGASVFTDSVAPGEDVLYYLHGTGRVLGEDRIALESRAPADVVENLRDGSIGGARRNPEYLILAPAALLPEAVQLRAYRDNPARLNPMNTAVVRLEDVYREWSGGRLSPPAIRDFLRWVVNRWGPGDGPGALKHVLLFGDGHYDYRNLVNSALSVPKPNHVPPFNWVTSGSPNPLSTDDFFAVLDSGASWQFGSMAVAIGRLPVQTRAHAQDYLVKIARYESPSSAGEWRSRLLMIGDDDTQRGAPERAGCHTCQVERVGNSALALDSGLRPDKLYLFDYQPNASQLKPEATVDLLNLYNRGTLMSVYFGHGAHNQIADEVLLKTNDGLSRLRNGDKNFFLTIFSCTVGRFDKLADEGMSEQFLRMRDHGAIAAISGARETYANENETLAKYFMQFAFAAEGDTLPRATGEALRRAKNAYTVSNYDNTRKYIHSGEPVLVLNRPGLGLQVDSVPDMVQGLACGNLSGRVARGSGRGAVNVRILSSDVIKTYNHRYNPDSGLFDVKKRGQILFEATVPYVDSVFSLRYVLPKQVPFGDTAKIQIFAWDSLQLRESALLVSNIPIAGTLAENPCLEDDQRGPRIQVSGCNAREAGEVDFPDKISVGLPYCFKITVSDSSGGVLAGDGPDQGTTVEVVGSVAPFQPQAGLDELQTKSYQVTLSPQEVSEGTHLLKIAARDGFGNLGQRQITLQVARDTALRFVRAFNVPNPMKNAGTTFWFSSTLPADEGGALTEPLVDRVRYHVRVFNQQGYMVREFRDAVSGQTRWDGRDAWGRRLANGVYFYEVTATWDENNGGPVGGRSVSRRNTLVISR